MCAVGGTDGAQEGGGVHYGGRLGETPRSATGTTNRTYPAFESVALNYSYCESPEM